MKQLLQDMKSGETLVAEVPIPSPQEGEALVMNAASLVSAGTERMLVAFAEKSMVGKAKARPDLVHQVVDKARREGVLTTIEAARSRLSQPMALGYSSAGRIVGLGRGMEGFRIGQRVACAGGGYAVHAEYVCVPKNLLVTLPEEVDFDSAAFTTLGAIAMHGFRLAEIQLGERVAVIGLGLLGLLAVEIVRAAGCQVFGVDLDESRVRLAEELGATAVLREQAFDAAQNFSRGMGCDAVLICADTPSADPVELAGGIARDRGRVVAVGAVGLQLPRKVYYEKELTFLNSRSYGPGRYDPVYEEKGVDYPPGYVRWTEGRNLEAFVDLLAQGKVAVKPLITHSFPIDDAQRAYSLITGKDKEPFLGVLLTYPQFSYADNPPPSESSYVRWKDAVAEVGTAEEKPMGLKVGVLGAGNFAIAALLPALKKVPGLELIGIASASGTNAAYAGKRFGFEYATSDEEQVIQDRRVNTVAVLTRHNLHARQIIAALAAGKNVFCEKPLAINEAEVKSIIAALAKLENAGGAPLLTAGFNRRFAPLAVRMKSFLDERSEPLAAHYRINAGMIPLNHWTQDPEQGGGRIIGEACHFIDFLAYLVGESPSNVSGRGLPDGGRYREDNVILTFGFPDGSVGVVSYLANGNKAFPKERVEGFSSGRAAALDDFRTLELVENGRRSKSTSRLRQDKGHLGEWLAFSKAIQAGGPPPIPYQQLWGVAAASFAAVEALRSGETITIRF